MQSSQKVKKTWSQKGKTQGVTTKGNMDRILTTSAETPKGNLYFMTKEGCMDRADIIGFPDQLLSEIHRFLYTFWNNRTILMRRFVKLNLETNNHRLITGRIPAYFPELNPDVYMWKALKYLELQNFCQTGMLDLGHKVICNEQTEKNDQWI